MTTSAVVVSHGHAAELEISLAALAPQVDEIVVVANVPGSVGALPNGVRVIENPRPRCLAANVNAGIAATEGSLVLFANPDAVPAGDAVVEVMASGTPVVVVSDAALVEVAQGAAVVVEEDGLAEGIRTAIADRDRFVAAGIDRARDFSGRQIAESTVAVYRKALGR